LTFDRAPRSPQVLVGCVLGLAIWALRAGAERLAATLTAAENHRTVGAQEGSLGGYNAVLGYIGQHWWLLLLTLGCPPTHPTPDVQMGPLTV
jgi:hypothetical protein